MRNSLLIDTPLGRMTLTAGPQAVTEVRFGEAVPLGSVLCTGEEAPDLLRQTAREIGEYFAGRRRRFTVPLAPLGSEFQKKVWKALQTIGYGETRTYKEIALQIGHDLSYRAVGMANNRNPIALLIPCHRVIGYDGSLTGYAGGLEIKAWLLDFEKMHVKEPQRAL